MNNYSAQILSLLIVLLLLSLAACQSPSKEFVDTGENPYLVERSFPDYYLEHRKLFTEKQGTYQTGDHRVWTIHSPDLWIGNITFIETQNELIAFDASISTEAATFALGEIRKVSSKPITTLFYSHHHTDHYNGANGLVDEANVKAGKVKIYAWENFEAERADEFGLIRNRQTMGALYFSGALLDKEDLPYLSCCGTKVFGGKQGYIAPTHVISNDTTMTIDGLSLDIFHTGGEAISEFGIHIPKYEMVLIADEFFYSLPNLHSIRGSKPRAPQNYIDALDKVISLNPQWLLGSHIVPIEGKDEIQKVVTTSRDAIQYLWDQSIRHINKGYTGIELQHKLKELPEHLQLKPFTAPMYGSPKTAVPEFYSGWVSWFEGDAVDLFPDHPEKEAQKMVDLIGGRDAVLAAAEEAFDAGDAKFAGRLSQYLVRLNKDDMQARYLKAACLKQLGYAEMNVISRSWYLTGAKELEGKINTQGVLKMSKAVLSSRMPAHEILTSWRYLIDADKAGDRNLRLSLLIEDTQEAFDLELRNSVLVVNKVKTPSTQSETVRLNLNQLRDLARSGTMPEDLQAEPLQELVKYLDLEVPRIEMHIR